MFFKRLVDLKKDLKKFKIPPKTNEEYIVVKYGCIRFTDSYRFLSESSGKLVKNLDEDDFKILKKEFLDKWQYSNNNYLENIYHAHIVSLMYKLLTSSRDNDDLSIGFDRDRNRRK